MSVATLVVTGAIAAAVLAAGSAAASQQPNSGALGSPSGSNWTVPAGVYSITATVAGAEGGSGGADNIPGTGIPVTYDGAGGAGGVEVVTIPVTPGQVLDLYTSTQGLPPNSGRTQGLGWAQGGAGGAGNEEGHPGGGGGGASAIVDVATGTVLVVAGGGGAGGGAGGAFLNCIAGAGGAGGLDPYAGTAASGCAGNGEGGAGAASGDAGGKGGSPSGLTDAGGGGGGGGGYPGGAGGTEGFTGGGGGGGGAGGTSYVNTSYGVVQDSTGYNGGNGSITIDDATAINVNSSANPAAYGQSATLRVHVTDTIDSTRIPSGSVTMTEGANVLGTATLDASGDAQFLAPTSLGTHDLSFSYTPSANTAFEASSTVYQQVVSQAPVTVTAVSNDPEATTSNPPTINVIVAPQQAGLEDVPNGTVTASEGGTTLATVPLDANGVASFPALVSAAGRHDLTFTYNPSSNSNFTQGSGTLVQIIGQAAVTVTASSSDPAATESNPPTISVQVSADASGMPTPQGTVTESESGLTLSTAVVDASGVAQFPNAVTTVGTHNLTYTYTPSSSSPYAVGTTPFVQTIAADPLQASQMTALSSIVHPYYGGPSPVITVQVTAAAVGETGEPTGDVTAYVNGVSKGSAALGADGTAIFSHLITWPGQEQLTFTYTPANDSLFAASNTTLTQTMAPALVKMATSAKSHVVTYGSPIPITVTVLPRHIGLSPTPNGTINVTESLRGHTGLELLASAPVSAHGTATFRDLRTEVGVNHLTFTYVPSGRTPYTGQSIERYQVTKKAPTKLVLSSNDPRGNWHLHWPMLIVAVHAPHSGMPAPTGVLVITCDGRRVKTVKVRSSMARSFDVVPTGHFGRQSWPRAGTYDLVVRFIPAKRSPYRGARGKLIQKIT